MFALPIIATMLNVGYHLQKHIRKAPAPLKSFAFGFGYAAGTNVGYNVFQEFITPYLRTGHKYVGRPQYINRL